MVRARVREWHDELGWGVLESVETPGGCWAHFSQVEPLNAVTRDDGAIVSDYRTLSAGDAVELAWEVAAQDGFGFRAVLIRPCL